MALKVISLLPVDTGMLHYTFPLCVCVCVARGRVYLCHVLQRNLLPEHYRFITSCKSQFTVLFYRLV